MSMNQSSIVIILQTVRLPRGTEQYVIPSGCRLSRIELQSLLDANCVDASHIVVQPETGREGTERIVALRSEILSPVDQDQLRNRLRQWIADTDSIIEEVAAAGMTITDQLPTSERLTHWQVEAEAALGKPPTASASITETSTHPPTFEPRRLIAMSLLALLALAALITIPPFLRPPTAATGPDEAGVTRQSAGPAFEGWNFAQSKTFSGPSDALAALRPLVVRPTPDINQGTSDNQGISDEVELARLLSRINQMREGQPIEITEVEPELAKLVDSEQLKTYVNRLLPKHGEYDRFGLVEDALNLDSLRTLLPNTVDASTATIFRKLAHQLIGDSAIDDMGMKLTELENPFFDLADQEAERRSYEAMIGNIPRAFRNADTRCTFFTVDDCDAAKQILAYFIDIGFLTSGRLGFESADPRSTRMKAYAESKNAESHHFAHLLRDWQAFKLGQSPVKQNTAQPSMTDNE